MRAKYIDRLAGEILTGEPDPDSFSTAHMERGKEMEAEARAWYAMTYAPVEQVGFIRLGRAGASPDSLVGDAGGLEIKTAMPTVHLPRLRKGELPNEHRAQVQGNLWISGRQWWDFMSYWPGLPPLVIRVPRDEAYIAKLAAAVDAFNEELDAAVDAIRTFQDFRRAAA
ncbi:MAG: exonuclease [Alphaproteobacteria bacterium]|nr:MAG: exonuclease [Alphaproteobacteria bacterium]